MQLFADVKGYIFLFFPVLVVPFCRQFPVLERLRAGEGDRMPFPFLPGEDDLGRTAEPRPCFGRMAEIDVGILVPLDSLMESSGRREARFVRRDRLAALQHELIELFPAQRFDEGVETAAVIFLRVSRA